MARLPIPTNPQPIEQVPFEADLPTPRERIAAAYERSAWARLAFILVLFAGTLAGYGVASLAPLAVTGPLMVLWVLIVAAAGAWYIVPPYKS